MRKGAFMLLAASLTFGMAACSDDDPDYSNVTPPTVAVASNTLTGIISNMDGSAIQGATVTLSGTSTATSQTDSNGMYVFEDVKAGSYTLKAEADGKQSQETSLTVTDTGKTQNLTWNTVLPNEVKTEITVSTTESTSGNVTTEHLTGNDHAAIVVDAVVPANAVEGENVTIEITPIYTANSDLLSRAEETSNTLLTGASLSCSDSNATLSEPIELGFTLDEELAGEAQAKEYVNGQWVNIDPNRISVENGKVTIEATEFTSYAMFLDVTVSVSNSSEPIVFTQDTWDNLYGSADMTVGDATYTYRIGTEITTSGTNVLTALLIEKLAQMFGAGSTTVNGSYPLNVTLPIGTLLTISGTQEIQQISVSARNRSVSGTHYGTVTIGTYTANRQHTGGSN